MGPEEEEEEEEADDEVINAHPGHQWLSCIQRCNDFLLPGGSIRHRAGRYLDR